MTKKRHNIDTIAEVLIDKLKDMERTASRIEKASEKPLKLDLSELKRITGERERTEKSILNDLRGLKKKNGTRLPNWALGLLSALFLTCIGTVYHCWSKVESYEYEKRRGDHFKAKADSFEQKYNELLKEKRKGKK